MSTRKPARKTRSRATPTVHDAELRRMQAAHRHNPDDAMLARIVALRDSNVSALLAEGTRAGWTLRGSDCWLDPARRRAMVTLRLDPPARAAFVFDRSMIAHVDLDGEQVALVQLLGDAATGLLEREEDEPSMDDVLGRSATDGVRSASVAAKASVSARRCRIVIRNGRPIVVCT